MSHEHIWAPWRLAYILGEDQQAEPEGRSIEFPADADPDCFLCQAWADPEDRRRHVVCRNARSLVLLNRYPYNNGHLLVSPGRHCARLDDLASEEQLELTERISQMVGLLERVLSPQGFNIGLNLGQAGGAGHPGHLHWHVVPRWVGDTNFMSSVSSARVIPQSLDALWEALTAELGRS